MAIEFNCPFCSAMIRVPDSAGGGKGRCPRCTKRITVPKVSSKSPPKIPAAEDLFVPPGADEDEIVAADSDDVMFSEAAPHEAAEADSFASGAESTPADLFVPRPRALGELPVESVRQPLRPGSVASKLKRRKSGGSWVIPLGFGLVLIGAVGWFVWQQYLTERLVGELTAEYAATLELAPGEVDKSQFKQSPEEMKVVMEALEKSPVPFNSTLMQILIGANKRSITVRLNSGVQTQFYRVNVQDNPALINYRKNHTFELEELRAAELEKSGSDFVTEYQRVLDKKSSKSALNEYRNTLGIPALVRGLGLQLEAVYGQAPYRCVYEDRDGTLYFLLPVGAEAFEIRGSKHSGKVVFPGKYQVKVTGEMKSLVKAKAEPAVDKKKKSSESMGEEKPEMKEPSEDGGMKKEMDEDAQKKPGKSK